MYSANVWPVETISRAPGRLRFVAVLVLATIAVALLLLTVWEWVAAGSLAVGLPVAARVLFFFGDIAFYLWIPFLAIAVLRRGRRPRAATAFLVLLVGGILNVVVVTVIGFVQEGGLASFVALAVEGSTAAVVAGAVVIPMLYRGTEWGAVKPSPATAPPS